MSYGLNDDEALLVDAVRSFVDRDVTPTVQHVEHEHQSIGNYLADVATTLSAARQLTRHAAERCDSGQRCDMEAGMAKLIARGGLR